MSNLPLEWDDVTVSNWVIKHKKKLVWLQDLNIINKRSNILTGISVPKNTFFWSINRSFTKTDYMPKHNANIDQIFKRNSILQTITSLYNTSSESIKKLN